MITRKRLCATVVGVPISRRGWKNGPIGPKRTVYSMMSRKRKREETGSNRSGEARFSWNQVFLQWALGVYVSTPLIAILQGSLLLNDYRVNYSDAPRPLMPARGVAVAVEEDPSTSKRALSSWILHPFSSASKYMTSHERPLRLLVVGDSLAAGVGMSKSGVPILPESIARALSKALGGRAVYWTCVGTPGVSAAQIVKDIEQIEPYDPHPKGRRLEQIVKEFQIRRRRWQERHTHGDDPGRDSTMDVDTNQRREPMNALVEWWGQMRQKESFTSNDIANTTRQVVYEWWMQSSIRKTYRRRMQLVEEDISVIKEIVSTPLSSLNDDDDNYYYDYYRENLPAEDRPQNDKFEDKNDSSHADGQRLPLIRKGSLFRRPSVIPEAAAEYDVAVVLTGLNDVKEAFMPHMNSSGTPSDQTLLFSLRQVLVALQDKMGGTMDFEGNPDPKSSDHPPVNTTVAVSDSVASSSKSERREAPKNVRHPLVVVPELPVAPLQIFRLVPLCWFLVPIFRAMENNKRFLASCFPDNVVFVHQPNLCWWTDDEMGIGSIRENIKQERLLLRVTDTVRSGRERIERLMKQYYDSKEEELASQNNHSNSNRLSPNASGSKNEDDASPSAHGNNRNGSDLVSVDRMHPNDEGYELWGRHIAAAIIAHWNKDAAENCREKSPSVFTNKG